MENSLCCAILYSRLQPVGILFSSVEDIRRWIEREPRGVEGSLSTQTSHGDTPRPEKYPGWDPGASTGSGREISPCVDQNDRGASGVCPFLHTPCAEWDTLCILLLRHRTLPAGRFYELLAWSGQIFHDSFRKR